MMHGYLAFDGEGELLTPFRTWRNGTTGPAASALTELFHYNIPQRWSIAHLYQAILSREEHVPAIRYMTTLAGYVHWRLTGRKVLGVGDASGMFPIDIRTQNYDAVMLEKFDVLTAPENFPWKLPEILPQILPAGAQAGCLTGEGARLLDASGQLEAGIPLCPPEGDAGTGMTATNSVAKCTGNVSAGTSAFVMVVLEQELKKIHPEIDLVTTPDGSLVGMVHANNCTSDINGWAGLFREFAAGLGLAVNPDQLYSTLYTKALEGEDDCGGLLAYGYLSGENLVDVSEGRPMVLRTPESRFTLANFMRAHLYGAVAALKIGMDILVKEEQVQVDQIYGHGGFFKTPLAGQRIMAAAMGAKISVLETAGEGGPWGMALLAAYMNGREEGQSLQDYLASRIFKNSRSVTVSPLETGVEGFEAYIGRFKNCLPLQRAAAQYLTTP